MSVFSNMLIRLLLANIALPGKSTHHVHNLSILHSHLLPTRIQWASACHPHHKQELINFMEDNGGILDGEWHKFNNENNFHHAITKTRQLGGIVYDLPVKTGV